MQTNRIGARPTPSPSVTRNLARSAARVRDLLYHMRTPSPSTKNQRHTRPYNGHRPGRQLREDHRRHALQRVCPEECAVPGYGRQSAPTRPEWPNFSSRDSLTSACPDTFVVKTSRSRTNSEKRWTRRSDEHLGDIGATRSIKLPNHDHCRANEGVEAPDRSGLGVGMGMHRP